MSGQILNNELADLAETTGAVWRAHRASARDAAARAIETGYLLVAARDRARYGTWSPFLQRAGIPERQAQRLMQLARAHVQPDTVSAFGGIKATLEALGKFRLPEPGHMGADRCSEGAPDLRLRLAVRRARVLSSFRHHGRPCDALDGPARTRSVGLPDPPPRSSAERRMDSRRHGCALGRGSEPALDQDLRARRGHRRRAARPRRWRRAMTRAIAQPQARPPAKLHGAARAAPDGG